MSDFENRRPASRLGESGAGTRTDEHSTWRQIREWSVNEFVKRTSKAMGAPDDRVLRRDLHAMAMSDGQAPFSFGGLVYSGAMVLDVWRSGGEPDGTTPFPSRKEWGEFQAALAAVHDSDVPMWGDRRALLRIGASIEARQRPHAVAKGWAAAAMVAVALTGCQVSHTVEIRDAQTVNVTMTGDDAHARGGQTTDVAREAQAELGLAP